uniref:Tectonic-1-3 N-terminal domain-containing protein n=1 Tax=Mola mola TaxID=94237 RepID=A0A3Q3VSV1_MOLML
MNLHREGRSLHIFIVFFCGCLTAAAAATEPPFNSTANADFTSGEPVSSATPPPGGTVEATEPTGVGGTTELSFFLFVCFFNPACSCDLTPGFCDIGCCCDTVDCDVANLIFFTCSSCEYKFYLSSGVCVEKWLMFRANVDSLSVIFLLWMDLKKNFYVHICTSMCY